MGDIGSRSGTAIVLGGLEELGDNEQYQDDQEDLFYHSVDLKHENISLYETKSFIKLSIIFENSKNCLVL